jgi:class 3 adenylate cyclase
VPVLGTTLSGTGGRLSRALTDIVDIPTGSRTAYVVGDEPCVQIFWAGNRPFFASFLIGSRTRVLATLLFTDLVDSTAKAAELGDARWRALLSDHFLGARAELERYGRTRGQDDRRRVAGDLRQPRAGTAVRRGDFEPLRTEPACRSGPACTSARSRIVGEDVRGVTVHEAARIMAAAGRR